MANRLRGEATFEPAGLTLVFDQNALFELEDVLDRPLPLILSDLMPGKAVRHRTSAALVWAGARARHPDITLADAGELVLTHGRDLSIAVFSALEGSFPKAEPAEGKEPPRPPASPPDGTGTPG